MFNIKKYIDIQDVISPLYNNGNKEGLNQAKILEILQMEREGRKHIALDDALNLARICQKLKKIHEEKLNFEL